MGLFGGGLEFASDERITFSGELSKRQLKELVKNNDIDVLQTKEQITPDFAARLNDHFFAHRPDVGLRFFGSCDLSVCKYLTNVESFSADCLQHVENADDILFMPKLRHLSFGVYCHDSFDFLHRLNTGLTSLTLSQTKSNKLDLACLERLPELTDLFIVGHHKNIEAIAACKNLEHLCLGSISTRNVGFVETLNKLVSLKVHLGGIKDLSALAQCHDVKKLELYQVRGLSDLSFISDIFASYVISHQDSSLVYRGV
jgi:hypothetical protein